MTHRTAVIFILALSLMRSTAFAHDETNKMINIVFPSDNQITVSQLIPVTEKDLMEIQTSIELPSDECLEPFRAQKFSAQDLVDLVGHVWKVDFSGDGVDDLIFSTYCRSEEIKNYFWVRKNDRYYYSGLMIGTLVKLFHTTDSRALSAATRGGWCCFGQIGFNNLYTPTIDNQGLKYKLVKSVSEYGNITLPDKTMPTKRFVVMNDKYKLRQHPVIDDKYNELDSDFERMPVYGNTLAKFLKGSKGEAIAEKEDEIGRVWWFVIMDADAKVEYNRFHDDANEYKAGWMSSRFLKVIK